jgi:aminoglycoside phosphotransferase (APT) family kinase protein
VLVVRLKMHAEEFETTPELVQRLIAQQFEDWRDLPVAEVASSGTDNVLYRLGVDLVVRMPRVPWATGQIAKDRSWLPVIGPGLYVAVPELAATGEPSDAFPWAWSVYRWIDGNHPDRASAVQQQALGHSLAQVLQCLQRIDTTGGPLPGASGSDRGTDLINRDTAFRAALQQCAGLIDCERAALIWHEALVAPAWNRPGRWIHGDVQPTNLLMRDDELVAVIDWGCMGVGDPAVDLLPAWNFFTAPTRLLFRERIGADDAMWSRGRGWAVSTAVIALPYYLHTNPVLAGQSRLVVHELLDDLSERMDGV